jgi:hypothetical protein
MPMTLGDAFSRRKQIQAEIDTWINRLQLAGKETTTYQTKEIEGENKFEAIPGTKKEYERNYTIEECKDQINQLIEEDKELALKISLTNQKARAKLTDLDGNEVEFSIPELIVLKNSISPKLERAAQAVPRQSQGVEIMEQTEDYTKWRSITPYYKTKQSLSEQGHKIEEEYVDYYQVQEVVDYGVQERDIFDEIDKIHAWQQRLKEAINQANKTELIELE